MNSQHEISLRERIRLNLIAAMEKANINQVQLAEKLNISKGTVNNWARGNNSPDVDTVPKICEVLGISILDLYSETKSESIGTSRPEKTASPLSDKLSLIEQDHIKKYRTLDSYGKEAVDEILAIEYRRCSAPDQTPTTEADVVVFIMPGFLSPMSAGVGQPAGEDYPENYHLTKEPPRGASYIATVSGDSMEPTFHNGDKLFIHACTDIAVGQIGVFYMNGQQWVKELGGGELISHNSDYPPRPITEDIICQGLVLGVCDDSYFE